jgi:hypothetical protein
MSGHYDQERIRNAIRSLLLSCFQTSEVEYRNFAALDRCTHWRATGQARPVDPPRRDDIVDEGAATRQLRGSRNLTPAFQRIDPTVVRTPRTSEVFFGQVQDGAGLVLPGELADPVCKTPAMLVQSGHTLCPPDDLLHVAFLGQSMQDSQFLCRRRVVRLVALDLGDARVLRGAVRPAQTQHRSNSAQQVLGVDWFADEGIRPQ